MTLYDRLKNEYWHLRTSVKRDFECLPDAYRVARQPIDHLDRRHADVVLLGNLAQCIPTPDDMTDLLSLPGLLV